MLSLRSGTLAIMPTLYPILQHRFVRRHDRNGIWTALYPPENALGWSNGPATAAPPPPPPAAALFASWFNG